MNEEANGIESGKIIRRKGDGAFEFLSDDLTVEEPLEIRIRRKTLATTMRTPGHDEELAAGFLLSEGIVRPQDKIEKFSRPANARNRDNVVIVEPAAGVKLKSGLVTRLGTISSSCGICGKESIDAIRQKFSCDWIDESPNRHRNPALTSRTVAKTSGRFCPNRRNPRRRNFRYHWEIENCS